MSAQPPAARKARQTIRSIIDENASRAIRPPRARLPSSNNVGTTSNSANPPTEKPVPAHMTRAENAITAAKRKREALGEVTNKNKNKPVDGKGDLKDGLKKPSTSAGTARVALGERKSTANVASTRHLRGSSNAEKEVDDVKPTIDDAMAVDDQRSIRASRRISTRVVATASTTISTRATSTATASTIASRRQAAGSTARGQTATAATARSRVLSRRPLGSAQARVEVDDVQPVLKKRRTSSVDPEEKPVKEEIKSEETESVKAEVQEDEDTKPVLDDRVARAEGNVWDDLDKEDEGDPLMVSEYVADIFQYLQKLEIVTMPNPRYMDTQADLAWRMRGILTDWLIQIHGRFRLLPETLFLTINMIDRFLSSRVVSILKLQLVGITSLFIAAKYEEIMAPSIAHFLRSADGNYGEQDIREAEKYILRTLDWNMSYPNPIHFLRRSSKADGYDLAVRTMAKYFIEISCLEHRLLYAPPSLIAAAGMWFARLVLDKEEWTPNLVHYSGYEEDAIIPTARLMLNYILKPTRHDNFFNKYAGRKFMKASIFAYSWARDRWPEGTLVDLVEELPELRLAAQARREDGTAAGQLAEEKGELPVS